MSTSAPLQLFGRAYSLKVTLPAKDPGSGKTVLTLASSGFEPEALRITFDVYMQAYKDVWWADISVFNLDQQTTQQIIGGLGTAVQQAEAPQQIIQGMHVELAAGYQELSTAPPIVYSPPSMPAVNTAEPPTPASQGVIIGTPEQTQHGFNFRTLLDPRIMVEKPLMLVKLDHSQLRLQKLYINQYPGFLDTDLVGVVGQAHFFGDSRGNDWYTDVGAWTVVGDKLAWYLGAPLSMITGTTPSITGT